MDASGVSTLGNNRPGISLVLISASDGDSNERVINDAATALSQLTDDWELIVLTTGEAAGDHAAAIQGTANPTVKVVSAPTRAGYGAALRCGLRAATKPLVGYVDTRGQFDFAQLDRFLLLAREHDVVCGYRLEQHGSWPRRILDSSFSFLARWLLGTEARDCNCAFKLLKRDVLQDLPLEADGALIHAELLSQARLRGHSVIEVGVSQRPPIGKSQASFLAILVCFLALIRYWWSVVLFPKSARQEPLPAQAAPRFGLLLLLLLAAPVLLLNLSYPLLEPDENRNAQIALEMHQSGDYVVPTRIGQPYLYKPPLLFWLVSGSYQLFGMHEWAARLPVALCALTTVLATYLLGQRVVGPRAAWLGAALLLLTGGFVLAGRFLLMDVPLTMFTCIASLAAYGGATGQRGRAASWLLAGLSCGLGILLKGPVALVLVIPPLAAATWIWPGTMAVRWREWAGLVGLALAVALPWYVLVTIRHPEFPQTFLWTQNLQRFATGIDHEEPWWFYGPVMLVGVFPASWLLPALAIFLGSRRPELRSLRTPGLGFLTLSAAWVVLFFSLSSSKLPTYILPTMPPLSLLLGRLVDGVLLVPASGQQVQLSGVWRKFKEQIPRDISVAMSLICLGGVVVDFYLGSDGWLGTLLSGLVVASSGLLLVAAVRRGIPATKAGWSLAGAAALVAMAFGFNDLYPEIAAERSRLIDARAEVEAARELARADDLQVALFGTLSEGTSFYMDDRGLRKFSKDQVTSLIALAQREPRLIVVATGSNASVFQQALPPTHQLIRASGRHFVFELVDRRSQQRRSVARGPAPQSR